MPNLHLPDDAEQSDNYPYAVADERYVVVRKPDEQGAAVAKFSKAGEPRFPKELHDITSLVITYPGSRSALDAVDVDRTVDLTDDEERVLERSGWIVD